MEIRVTDLHVLSYQSGKSMACRWAPGIMFGILHTVDFAEETYQLSNYMPWLWIGIVIATLSMLGSLTTKAGSE